MPTAPAASGRNVSRQLIFCTPSTLTLTREFCTLANNLCGTFSFTAHGTTRT